MTYRIEKRIIKMVSPHVTVLKSEYNKTLILMSKHRTNKRIFTHYGKVIGRVLKANKLQVFFHRENPDSGWSKLTPVLFKRGMRVNN